jgi:SAM-dependent methyltransferase
MHNLNAMLNEPITGFITDISPRDIMAKSLPEGNYYLSGLSALRNIRLCMMAANLEDCQNILDLACGHGRVLRMLKAAFPKARLTACDIDGDAVEFCRRTIDAAPVQSVTDPAQILLADNYDLIWVGSLFTHLGAGRWPGFLERCSQALRPGGVLVFTALGRVVEQRFRSGIHTYGLRPQDIAALLDEHERTGFGYQDYPGKTDYGLSLCRPSWVCRALAQVPSLRLMICLEAGWFHHQDVFGCVRLPE